MTVSPAQQAAFKAGSGVAPATVVTAVATITVLLAFIWVVWVVLGSFKAWQNGQCALFDVLWAALRASIVLMVLGFYLR